MELVSKPDHDKHDLLQVISRTIFSRIEGFRVQYENQSLGIRVFHKWHFAKKKRCNTSMHPSRVYMNQIWKNFFPKTSLEGLATWSKKATQGSLFVAKTYFLIIVQPLWIPSGVPRRGCSIFFCPNTLPFFATDTYKLVAQGSLFIWVYSDYLSFSI